MSISEDRRANAAMQQSDTPGWLNTIPAVGMVLTLLGVIIGVVRGFHVDVDGNHPFAFEGFALAIVSALLGVLISLATAFALDLRERTQARPDGDIGD